eukprot:CAMPEP_0184526518 /NCGR_PEP_ID=MMETSP0198_2-20121128/10697_1 /TAXON_ID=1112570 /ORGANISM="Thraustochytrium sp., Strain LLF1b" /LENGTH=338 /DNA_ID=CAMNT_0026918095 /DNA_START=60 /DNA_END=1076 /DNA_ORIENTATION=-
MDGVTEQASGPAPSGGKRILRQILGLVITAVLVTMILGFAFLAEGREDEFLGSVIKPFWGPLTVVEATAFISLFINWLAYIPALAFQTEKFYDLTGSITFLSCTWYSFAAGRKDLGNEGIFRPIIASIMVSVWAIRLGSFLFARILKDGKDDRFDEIKVNPIRFLMVWTLQATWVFLTAFAAFLINASNNQGDVTALEIVGYLVYIVGFGIEIVSDSQKRTWRAKPENKGTFIEDGLWYYSRHPNYFGEMLLWLGVFLTAAPFLEGAQFIVILSPIFVFSLIYFVSGVRLGEAKNDKKWGGQPDYENYKATTSVLVILPKLGKRVHQTGAGADPLVSE